MLSYNHCAETHLGMVFLSSHGRPTIARYDHHRQTVMSGVCTLTGVSSKYDVADVVGVC